jgi:wobble nucleotide-excising tRNase
MIQEIQIRKCATYDDDGCTISNLNKVNLIYGANGTGKTTISNLIRDPADQRYAGCKKTWRNGTRLDTLVYNKEFKDENFGTGNITGVFTLGKATVEEIEEIDKKSIDRAKIVEDGKRKRETLEKQKEALKYAEDKFRESLWSKLYKKNERNFKDGLRGFIGSKEAFKNKILLEFKPQAHDLPDIKDLLERSKTIFADTIPTQQSLIETFESKDIADTENRSIWGKIVVGKSDVEISKLIHKHRMDDWVNEGRSFIEDTTCPFCQQQTITARFIEELEGYFDESYLKELELLRTLKNTYDLQTSNTINILEQIELHQRNTANSKFNLELFSSYIKTLIQQFHGNRSKIEIKIKEPSRKVELDSTAEQCKIIIDLIDTANTEILKHNDVVNNFEKEKELLSLEIWKYLVEEERIEIEAFIKEEQGFQKGIASLDSQIKEKQEQHSKVDKEIKALSQNLTDIQPTIDEINKLLNYYGFINFKIVKSDQDGIYQIQREDGTFAHHTLSEGEVTFITFLYFLQLAKGSTDKDKVTDDRILVIDDPISSLDSNILFIVSTLIKSIVNDVKAERGNIKQIIILTHNIYFHKEVSFTDSRSEKLKEVSYWILRKNGSTTSVQEYGMVNPIQSSYTLLWEEFKNDSITSTVSIQNIMRRIIENYFRLLGKFGDDKLIEKFESKEEKYICRSLISWINDGSHSIHDDLFIELPTQTIETYKRVFKDIFERSKHISHYNMMMGIEE